MTPQAFGSHMKKDPRWKPKQSPTAAAVDKKKPAYKPTMKWVSKKVVAERSKANGKSTDMIINEYAQTKGVRLIKNTVNKHIKHGLAGKEPKLVGRREILPADATEKIISYAEKCADEQHGLGVSEMQSTV